jgi:hypothetical protein
MGRGAWGRGIDKEKYLHAEVFVLAETYHEKKME